MTHYRIYRVGADDHFEGRPLVLDCANDEAAIEAAKQFVDGCDIELWQGCREVARLQPSGIVLKPDEQV